MGWSRFWWAAWDHFKWLDHHSEYYQPKKLPKTLTLMKFTWMRQTSSVELNSCCFRYIYQVFWVQPFLKRCRSYKILHHTKKVLKKEREKSNVKQTDIWILLNIASKTMSTVQTDRARHFITRHVYILHVTLLCIICNPF